MTYIVENWTQWLKNSRFAYMSEEQREQTLRWLFDVRDRVLDRANLKNNDVVIDLGTGTGLLAFGAYERLQGSGKVIASDKFEDCLVECQNVAKDCGIESGLETLQSCVTDINLLDNSVDVAVMRSVLVHVLDKEKSVKEVYRILKEGGRVSIFEPIISSNTKYFELINPDGFDRYEIFKQIEKKITSNPDDPITNFTGNTLEQNFIVAGFKNIDVLVVAEESTYPVSASMIEPWFNTPPSPGTLSLKEKFLQHIDEQQIDEYINYIKSDLDGKTITVKTYAAYISAQK